VKRRSTLERSALPYFQPIRYLAYLFVAPYHRIVYRVRTWGNVPRKRGATLIVANHQHEIESPLIVAELGLKTFNPRFPIFTVSSRRMWEPGFFAERVPWLKVAREMNFGWLFEGIGMQPIENELTTRPFAGIAHTLIGLEGNLNVDVVFKDSVLATLPAGVTTLADLLTAKNFAFSRSYVRITDILEPYKTHVMKATREQLDADIAHFEDLVRDGATIFLAPEGFYSGDGKMQKLRGILPKLQNLATIYLTAISYDPYVRKRLTMLYRVAPARKDVPLDTQLKATRPVTTSALLCTWIASRERPFSEREAIVGVTSAARALPNEAFVVPELQTNLDREVGAAIAGMVRLGTLELRDGHYVVTDNRTHPEFPHASDMLHYQVNFHAETLEGLGTLSAQS
jgi:hypothetical protein